MLCLLTQCPVLHLQIQEMVHSEVAAYDSGRPGPLLGRPAMLASHMTALSQSQLISQMGFRSGIAHSSPSPPGSKSATPSPSSSTQEEESEAHFKVGRVGWSARGAACVCKVWPMELYGIVGYTLMLC